MVLGLVLLNTGALPIGVSSILRLLGVSAFVAELVMLRRRRSSGDVAPPAGRPPVRTVLLARRGGGSRSRRDRDGPSQRGPARCESRGCVDVIRGSGALPRSRCRQPCRHPCGPVSLQGEDGARRVAAREPGSCGRRPSSSHTPRSRCSGSTAFRRCGHVPDPRARSRALGRFPSPPPRGPGLRT